MAAERLARFDLGEGRSQPAAETLFRTTHLALSLRLWPEERRFEAEVELRIQVVAEGLTQLGLDAAELDIRQLSVNGQATSFHQIDHRLTIELEKVALPGTFLEVKIAYRASPRFGLFFLGPDADAPQRPAQVWTQGQDDYTRYWLPCLDAPNQKATSEVKAEVPGGWEVISNGRLVDVAQLPSGRRRFHWSQDVPHSPYLISLVAGKFSSWHEERDGVRFSYHVPPGREADGRRALGQTPEMVACFARLTGVAYPFAKYAQTCVADFIFGGMENSSATTLTDRTLHDLRGNLDQTSAPLVAHELAHQWFGDLVTCRSWSHSWLNEGFATYYQHLWTEHDLGADEFEEELSSTRDAYLEEDQGRYRRAIVEDRYDTPAELFDRHLYNKGAWVLHMLRAQLGPIAFDAAIQRYLIDHRGQTVETVDLARAIEKTTGRNFDPFFKQWVFQPGHPELRVSLSYAGGAVTLRLRQSQPEEPFRFPLEIALSAGGELRVLQLQVSTRDERFDVPLGASPDFVCIDPRLKTLASWSIEKPEDWWIAELGSPALSPGARGRAAQGLARAQRIRAVPALRQRLLAPGFWGEQAHAAAALGELRGQAALEALGEGLALPHPKARRAVVRALGQFRDARAAELLAAPAARDPSCLVEGEALKALARTRQPGAREQVEAALARESDQGVTQRLALEGLGEAQDAAALPAVRARLRAAEPVGVRVAALAALGKLGRGRPALQAEVLDALIQLLEDGDFYVRLAACEALGDFGEGSARAPLERLRRRDPSGRVQRAAREAMARLSQLPVEGSRGEVEALRAEVGHLRQELSELAGQIRSERELPRRGGSPKQAPAPPKARQSGRSRR